MKVMLISHTPNPEMLVAMAAKLCYSSSDLQETINKVEMTPEKTEKFIMHLGQLGHGSPLEHVKYNFAVEGISRVLSHQLVRHRIASYSQKSQRYVNEKGFEFIIPPKIKNSPFINRYIDLMAEINTFYKDMTEYGIPNEDARYILPNAAETKLFVSFNARSLLNFFSLRCCTRAQWEIRELANKMLALVKPTAPHLFCNAGPACVQKGFCPEAFMSCGRYPTFKELKEGYDKSIQLEKEKSWANAVDMCSVEPEEPVDTYR